MKEMHKLVDTKANNNYEDIINLPHHVSTKHPQMSIEQRAAQFAPFAALVGFEERVKIVSEEVEKSFED